MGKKKAALQDLDDLDEDGNVVAKGGNAADEEDSQPAAGAKPKASKKKEKKAGKKGKAGFDDDDDDFVDPLAKAGAAAADSDDEPLVPEAKAKAPKVKAKATKPAASVFALLGDEDGDAAAEDEDEQEDEEEAIPQVKPKSSKAKSKPAPKKPVFAALDPEEDEEAEDSEEPAAPASKATHLVIAEVLMVKRHPKADKLMVVELDDGEDNIQVVTNAMEVQEGMKIILAPVGCTTPGSSMSIERREVKGIESAGMLCSAYDIGWLPEPDNQLVVMPDDSNVGQPCPDKPPKGMPLGKSKSKSKGSAEEAEAEAEDASSKKDKKKKKGKDMDSLFAALEADAEAAAAPTEETPKKEEKKEKKKKGKDIDSLFAALEADAEAASAPAEEPMSEKKPEKKEKKKKGKDIDSLFAALEADAEAAAEPAPAPEPEAPSSSGKGGKSGGKKSSAKAAEDEELDALLAELDKPKEAAQPAAGGGKKDDKKKKKKGGKADAKANEDEDIDALLAQIDGKAPAAAAPAPAAPAAEPAAPAAEAAPPAAGGDNDEDGDDAEGEGADGKELTAAQKKKLKKKQKEKEKKAAAASGTTAEGGEEAADEEAAGGGKKKGGKPVKESAIAKKLREQLEARRKAEEEAARLEAERIAREEEEARLFEEEEARKREEAERRKEEKRLKREQLKKEGKLLTGKAKEEAERRAAIAAQLLAKAAERGIELPTKDGAAADGAPKHKKVVYAKKKTQQKKKDEQQEGSGEQQQQQEQEAASAPEPEQVSLSSAPSAEPSAAAELQTETSAPPPAEEEEDAADDWEALDEDAILLPLTKAASSKQLLSDEEEEEKPAPSPEKPTAAKAAGKAAPAPEPSTNAPAQNGKHKADDKGTESGGSEDEGDEEEESGSESDDEEESGSESGSEEESSEEDSEDESDDDDSEDDSDDDSDDESEDEEEARERRIEEARDRRLARAAEARKNASKEELRSPICCILGHVDVGKTKILDNIRRTNVQDGEAGGITQQIGATFVPAEAIERRTEQLRAGGTRGFDLKLPGLLVIDTPGHESFTNLRQRGSGLCDIAVLIVDLMHGLEQQTIESIGMLKMRKTPFIIALNKVDRLYGWKSVPDCPIRDAFKRQKEFVMTEFEQRCSKVFLELNEQGLNVSLYWKNPDPRKFVNVVPTSAITGEGIPDLLQLLVKLTQTMMGDRLMYVADTQCTVLEVKTMEGLGTTVDVVLVNGKLKEGDKIVVCGMGGPIVTRVKALKTPQVLRELRVKGALMDHKEIRAAMGVKIVAPGLETAVAGTSLFVMNKDDDEEELKDAVMEDMADIFSKVDKGGEGVCVQASTLGSLEALLTFLDSPEVGIPVAGINIGPVHKRDVLRANVMNERKVPKYAVILAFDVPVAKEARELAEELKVNIFTADIIYHLFDQFTAYVKQVRSSEQEAAARVAVFPVVLRILPTCIFNKKDPIVMGVDIVEGQARIGTPIVAETESGLVDLGRIAGMEINHKAVTVAKPGESVAMKIEGETSEEKQRLFGRHFDHKHRLISRISRESIDALKEHFRNDVSKDEWRLILQMKKIFQIN